MKAARPHDLEDTLPYIVRLGENDDGEAVLLYRVPLEDGGDRVPIRPHEGRSWTCLGLS